MSQACGGQATKNDGLSHGGAFAAWHVTGAISSSNGDFVRDTKLSRRAALSALGMVGASLTVNAQSPAVGSRRQSIAALLTAMTPESRNCCERRSRTPRVGGAGSVPDDFNLHSAGTAGALIDIITASLVCKQSKFHEDLTVAQRIALGGWISGTGAKRRRLHRPAFNQFQFAAGHRLSGAQRRDGSD